MSRFLEYFSLSRRSQKIVDSAAEQLAMGLKGKLVRGVFLKGMPTVSLSTKNIPVQITYYTGSGRSAILFTRFILSKVTHDNFYMRVYHPGFLSQVAKKFGLQGIKIGDPEFSKVFMVRSNDEESAKRLLVSKTKHIIEALYQKPTIYDMGDVSESLLSHADDKGMADAIKLVELIATPSCPTFELRLDKRGLCLEVLGLISEVEKAQRMLESLLLLYTEWHLFA